MTPPDRACLRLTGLLTLAVAMVAKSARQECAALLMGKLPYISRTATALTNSLDTAARLRTIVARGANLSSATALEAPNTSADIRNSTDIFFAAVDFISEPVKRESWM